MRHEDDGLARVSRLELPRDACDATEDLVDRFRAIRDDRRLHRILLPDGAPVGSGRSVTGAVEAVAEPIGQVPARGQQVRTEDLPVEDLGRLDTSEKIAGCDDRVPGQKASPDRIPDGRPDLGSSFIRQAVLADAVVFVRQDEAAGLSL